MTKIKPGTKLLGFALPVATAITLFALLAAGGLPQVGGLPDLIAFALELAPRTMYAIAVGGSAAVAMHYTGMDLPNVERAELYRRAVSDRDVLRVLVLESACWLAWAVFFAVVYHPWS